MATLLPAMYDMNLLCLDVATTIIISLFTSNEGILCYQGNNIHSHYYI